MFILQALKSPTLISEPHDGFATQVNYYQVSQKLERDNGKLNSNGLDKQTSSFETMLELYRGYTKPT